MMVLVVLGCFGLVVSSTAHAQNPGGVGGSLLHWYKADDGPNGGLPANGTPVTSWTDRSTNGNDANVILGTPGHISLLDDQFNFNPGVDLDSSSVIFERTITDDFTIYVVFKTDENSYPASTNWYENPAIIGGDTNVAPSPQRDFGLTMRNGNISWSHDGSDAPGWTSADQYNQDIPYLVSLRRRDTIGLNPAPSSNTNIFLNGDEAGAVAWTVPTEVALNDVNVMHLGDHNIMRPNTSLDATYAEVIIYGSFQGVAARRRIHTYLCLKYGINKVDDTWMAGDGTTTIYTGGIYDNQVIGIGNDANSGLHQKQSKPSDSLAGISLFYGTLAQVGSFPATNQAHPLAMNAGSFLVTGHDSGATTFSQPFSGLVNSMWERVYQVEETGTVSDVTVLVPSSMGLSPTQTYYAVISSNNTFDANDIVVPMTPNAQGFHFEYDFAGGTSYFTVIENNPGPGGVSSNLVMWYKADSAGPVGPQLADGTGIGLWRDAIGNLNTLNITAGVTLETGEVNFNPIVRTGGTGYIDVPGKNATNADIMNQEFSVFTAFNTESGQGLINQNIWYDQSSIITKDSIGNNVWGITYEPNGSINFGLTNSSEANTTQTNLHDGVSRIVTVLRSPNSASNLATISLNGGTPVAHNNGTSINATTNSFIRLSESSFATGQHLVNQFGDVLFYNSLLTAPEVQKIESYLALKYGVTLPHSYYSSLDTLLYSPVTSGGFNNDIIGIGNDPFSSLDQRQSRSQTEPTGLALYNGGGFGGNFPNQNTYGNDPNPNPMSGFSFVVTGHNNLNPTLDDPFGGFANSLMPRIYRAEETGTVGTVTLLFPPATFTDLAAGNQYSLIVSTNNAVMEQGDATFPMNNIVGSDSFYVQVDLPSGTSYFSIIRESDFSPGGVDQFMTLWLRADQGAPVANGGTWTDISGSGNNPVYNGLTGNLGTGSVNFNPSLDINQALDSAFCVPGTMNALTIFAVGRVGAGASPNPHYLGYDGAALRGQSSGGAAILDEGNSNFIGPQGNLVFNSSSFNTANIANWGVVTGFRDSTNAAVFSGGFCLGGAGGATTSYGNYEFAEVVVYDSTMGSTLHRRIESYLAIRYGITLSDNYVAPDSSIIYPVGGYATDIAIVGRDDGSLLNQKQSRSINPTGIVTIAIDSIRASNALNSGTFGNDLEYAIVASNLGAECWTTTENGYSADPNQDWRIDREWRIATAGGYNANLWIQVDIDDPDFDIPAAPTGGSAYFLILDDDGDFNTGTTNIRLFDMAGAGTRSALLTPAEYTATPYFTIGTTLADSVWLVQDLCSGNTITFSGSFLADAGVCTRFTFDDGTNTFELLTPDFTSPVDNPGNCVDELSWNVNVSFASFDGYHITVDTFQGAPCVTTGPFVSTNLQVATDSITIGVSGSTVFDYPLGGEVCVGEPNFLPNTTSTTAGGIFYLDSSSVGGINPSWILGSDTTGEILVHPGSAGQHFICYTLPGNCAGPDGCDTVTIRPVVNSSFAYASPVVCNTVTTIDSVTGLTHPGGTFSVLPALLNPTATNFVTTGAIDPSLQNPGTYVITYTPPADSCVSPSTATVEIQPVASLPFTYPDPVACTNQSYNPVPVLGSAQIPGSYVCVTCGNPTDLDLNAGTGEIDPALSLPGSYTVEFQPSGLGCFDTTSTTILIEDPDSIQTFLLDSTYCANSGFKTIVVSPAAAAGTAFPNALMEDLSGNLAIFQPGATSWRFSSNLAPVGGPYPVMYSYTDAQGCTSRQVKLTEIVGLPTSLVNYPQDTFCTGAVNNPSPVFSNNSLGGGTFTSVPAGSFLNPTTGEITLDSLNGVTSVVVTYRDTVGSCFVASPVGPDTLIFVATPDPRFQVGNVGVDSICEGQTNIAVIDSGGAPVFIEVWAGNTQVGTHTSNSVASNMNISALAGDTTYTLYNIAIDQVWGMCRDTAVDYLRINPLDIVDFDYGIDSVLCSGTGDPDPLPAVYGTGGGIYSSTSAFVDPVNGQLFLDSTQAAGGGPNHFIVYQTQGACPVTDSIRVFILPGTNASFNYLTSVVCNSQDSLVVSSVATPGGNFNCLNCPPSVTVNQQSGTLYFTNLLVDTIINVEHSFVSAGFCSEARTRSVEIDAERSLNMFFSPVDSFCPIGTAQPTLVGAQTSEGTFTSQFGLTYLDIDQGIINLSSSVFGIHNVQFILDGTCRENVSATMFIRGLDNANFVYQQASLCFGSQPSVSPILQDSNSLGTFSYTAPQNDDTLTLDPATGIVDLTASTEGVFQIEHISGGDCPDTASQALTIAPIPNIGNLDVSPNDTICGTDTVEIRILAGGIPRFIRNGQIIPNTPTLVITDPIDGETITAIITSTDNCADTGYVTLTQNVVPDGDITTWPNTVSGDEEIEVVITSLSDVTEFHWTASASANVTLETTRDTTIMVNTGENASILNNVELDSDYNPGTMEIVIVPFANGCWGDTIFLPIDINPNNEAVFIPGVFTPNGDTKNDTWQIQWRSDIGDPENHTIEVYNRTGGLVYTMEGLTDTWTGDSLPDGVYWYILKDPAGETLQAGGLTIRRR